MNSNNNDRNKVNLGKVNTHDKIFEVGFEG